jgi:hypothetical protein
VFVINGTEGLVIGDGRIVWDSANNALKVIKANGSACNFYSLGGIAALGLTSGTSASLTNLEVTNMLTVRNKLNIGDSTCYIESLNNGESINIRAEQKIEMTDADLFMNGSSIHIAGNAAVSGYVGLYFDNTHYLYCSGSDLYFYNGSTHKKIAFV